MNRSPARALVIACIVLVAAAAQAQDEDLSYGYLRTVEGPARISQASSGATVEAEANYPVLAGDRLIVDPGGRLEISLPDFNVVRLGGGSELLLERLALSADSRDVLTALRLERGELQLLVKDLLPVEDRPRVDTANTTIYLQSSGVYRIATDGYGWTEVVVRQGFAELASEAGSSVVRAGELARVEGERWPHVGIQRAGGLDDLELWGSALDGDYAGYDGRRVDRHLSYAAAPLERHGSWVWADDDWAWRPSVGVAWRPYVSGWWSDTPLGLVWVSSEPWAWVTYHYGTWYPSTAFGWVWRPGRRFAPAWVYWYWGPTYAAWVPTGYYHGYYRHHRPYRYGFRFGLYGWAGGHWGLYADWTFCNRRDLYRRDLHRHARRGAHLARDTRRPPLERGLISTDSRADRREPRRAALRESVGRRGTDLPDVTAFVARRRDLPESVAERVFTNRRELTGPVADPAAARRRAIASRERLGGPDAVAGGGRPDRFRPRAVDPGGARSGAEPAAPRAVVPRAGRSETFEDWRRSRGFPQRSRPQASETPSRRTVPDRRALPAPGTRGQVSPERREYRRPTVSAPAPGRSEVWRQRAPQSRSRRPDQQPNAEYRSRLPERRPNAGAPPQLPPQYRGRLPERRPAPGVQGQVPPRQRSAREPVVRRVWEGIRSLSRGEVPRARGQRGPSGAPSRAPSARGPAPRRQPSASARSAPPRRAPSASRGREGSSARSRGSSGKPPQRSSGGRASRSRPQRRPNG